MSRVRSRREQSLCCFRFAAMVAFVGPLLTSSQTLAGPPQPKPSFELDWNSPSSCPQQFDVTDQIRSMLGAAPGATLPSGLHAEGELEPLGERFRLTLTIRLGQTERARVIESDDCSSLGKAAAVVLGLLIRREHESGKALTANDLGSEFEPGAAAGSGNRDGAAAPDSKRAGLTGDPTPASPDENSSHAPREPKSQAPSADPTQQSSDPNASLQTPDASTKRPWEPFLHLLVPTGSVDLWTLPHVGVGLGVGLGFHYQSWRWMVTGTLWSTQHPSHGYPEPYEARFSRKGGEAWTCWGWHKGSLELSPCAVGAIDLVGASASDSRLTSVSQRVALVSAGVGLFAAARVAGPIGVFLAASGRVAMIRPEFQVHLMKSVGETHTVPFGTVVTTIGSEWIF